MSAQRVVVTDYNFPDLEQEEAAVHAAGAKFAAYQCRSADEVAAALAGATVGIGAADSPPRQAPGVLLTPHAAWYSEAAIVRPQKLMAQDITNHLAGRPLRQPVPGSFRQGQGINPLPRHSRTVGRDA